MDRSSCLSPPHLFIKCFYSPFIEFKREIKKLNTQPILEVNHLSAWFGNTHVVKNVSLNFHHQTVTSIIGPSGCGKSTFIRCLNRLHEETPGAVATGTVSLEGKDIYLSNIDPVC